MWCFSQGHFWYLMLDYKQMLRKAWAVLHVQTISWHGMQSYLGTTRIVLVVHMMPWWSTCVSLSASLTCLFLSCLTRPEDTPFEDGTFRLELEFDESYPNKPPKVKFISKMFHPNGKSRPKIMFSLLARSLALASFVSSLQWWSVVLGYTPKQMESNIWCCCHFDIHSGKLVARHDYMSYTRSLFVHLISFLCPCPCLYHYDCH